MRCIRGYASNALGQYRLYCILKQCNEYCLYWQCYGLECREFEIFLSFPKFPDLPWNPLCLQFRGFWGSSLGLNQPGRELNHSPSNSVEVKNEWSYTAIPLHAFREKLPFFTCICCNVLVSTSTGSVVGIHTVENYRQKGINKSGTDSSVSLVTSHLYEEGGFILFTASDFSRRYHVHVGSIIII